MTTLSPKGAPRSGRINTSDIQVGNQFTVVQACSVTCISGVELRFKPGDVIEIEDIEIDRFCIKLNGRRIIAPIDHNQTEFIVVEENE